MLAAVVDGRSRRSLTSFQIPARCRPKTPVIYVAFDLLSFAGMDLTQKPLRERRALLEKFIVDTDRLVFSRTIRRRSRCIRKLLCVGSRASFTKDSESPYVQLRNARVIG